ncbi:MAG: hypothetical protein R2932_05525 [Caldilineaceae bacterium]
MTRQFQYEETLLAYEAEAIEDRREAREHPNRALQRRLADIKKRVEPRLVDRIIIEYYANLRIRNELCRVEGLTKSYGERALFQALSFEIQRGIGWQSLAPTVPARVACSSCCARRRSRTGDRNLAPRRQRY